MNKLPKSNTNNGKQLYNYICQGYGCLQYAIIEIDVIIGKFGTHRFKLCSTCALKFR